MGESWSLGKRLQLFLVRLPVLVANWIVAFVSVNKSNLPIFQSSNLPITNHQFPHHPIPHNQILDSAISVVEQRLIQSSNTTLRVAATVPVGSLFLALRGIACKSFQSLASEVPWTSILVLRASWNPSVFAECHRVCWGPFRLHLRSLPSL